MPESKSRPYRITTRDGFKACSKCKERKPEDSFWRRSGRAGGRQSRCKDCFSVSDAKNRPKRTLRARRRREENPEKFRAASERYRKRHPEKERARIARYRKENPERNRVACQKRRARKLAAKGDHRLSDILGLKKSQKGKCASPWCQRRLSGGYHIDHIKSLARGGANDPKNLQLLCPDCNHRKHAKDPIDFARQNGMLL